MRIGLIEFTRYPMLGAGKENEVLVGRLEIGATFAVTKTERDQMPEVWRVAKNEVRKKIWHDTYGDVFRALKEIRGHAVMSARDSHEAQLIDDKFKHVFALLEYPKIADETPDAPRMTKIVKGHKKVSAE